MNCPVKYIFLIITVHCTLFECYSQSTQCSDSVGSYYYKIQNVLGASRQYSFSGNLNLNVVDNNNNLIIQLDTADKNINGLTLGIAKLNSQNKLLFRKVYHNGGAFDSIFLALSHANNNNDIILSGIVVDQQSGFGNAGVVSTLDSLGNMKWQKKYRNPNPDPANFRIVQSCAGKNNDIVALSSDINSVNPYKIALLDSTGNIKWARSYDSFDSAFINIDPAFIVVNGSEIIMICQFEYDLYNHKGFCVSRIDYTTGKLLESKSYTIVSDLSYIPSSIANAYNHLNYNPCFQKIYD